MKIIPLFFTAVFLAATFSFGQSVADIVKTHETAKATALEQYLAGNPDAEDKDAANDALLAAYAASGQTEKQGAIYEKKYAAMEKGPDAAMRDVALGFIQPYMSFLAESRQKEKAGEMKTQILKDFKDHDDVAMLGQFLEGLMAEFNVPQVGDVLEIAGQSPDGSMVDLADMKGKVVLVDFWATWCGPCIAELPTVKKAYADYNEKGFEVLAISLDKKADTLTDFIKKRELPWPQIFDGKGWDSPLVTKYGITGIPATFLVGKDGKVLDTNLRGPALAKAVEAALK